MVDTLSGMKPNKVYEYVIIDGMNFAYRNHYGNHLTHEIMVDGERQILRTGMLYGFANLLLARHNKYPNAEFIVLWEGENSWRRKKYPFYKSNRKTRRSLSLSSAEDSEKREFYECVDQLQEFLSQINVKQVSHDTLEADDLAGYFVELYGEDVLLVSNDHDWQMLADTADVMVEGTILKKSPPGLFWHKVIRGDSSDKIPPGLPRIRSEILSKLLPQIHCTEDIPLLLKSMDQESWAKRAEERMRELKINVELITLHAEMVDESKLEWIPVINDPGQAEAILKYTGMKSTVTKFRELSYIIGRKG
jgi:5'-3' exonuclease